MNKAYDTLIAITANIIGFFSVPICFYTLLMLGIVQEDYFTTAGQITFKGWSATILGIWVICAAFSLIGIFVKQKSRYVLIASPAIIPIVYGLTTIFLYG